MDAISYSYADKAHKRIKKFINEPDSTSGIVTVPKVIASGETVTIPAGRVAILPNMQIDGVLNVEGEVFIPSGSTVSQVIPRVTSTDNAIVKFDGTTGAVQNSTVLIDDNGNLNITGTGKRITGDFSNATVANRVAFQTSTLNGNTSITIYPNGTSKVSVINAYSTPDPTNSSLAQIGMVGGESLRIHSAANGTGTPLPISFAVGGAERMRIDTAGNILLPGYGYTSRLSGNGNCYYNSFYDSSTTYDNNCISANFVRTGTNSGTINSSYLGTAEVQLLTGGSNKGTVNINTGISNTIPTTKLTIDALGNVLVVSPTGVLGYGTGSGGTVTQLTSKSTAVTLNKPTGQITMNSVALAAGATTQFQLTNSLIFSTDVLNINAYSNFNYRVECMYTTNGGAGIRVTNITASALSEALILTYVIIKGANS